MLELQFRFKASLDDAANEQTLERLLGEKRVRDLKGELVDNALSWCTHILIDLPDDNKHNLKAMGGDIDELQHLWESECKTINKLVLL